MGNPLGKINISSGVDAIAQKLQAPLNRYLSKAKRNDLLKAANERNDFLPGFSITPINKNGQEQAEIRLVAEAMPHDSLNFGGTQKIVKDYYPGRQEPTVQVLGPQENDITIKGRFKAKRLRPDANPDSNLRVDWSRYPVMMQEEIEALRVAGFLVRINIGDAWQRYGFISEATFEMKHESDIAYSITFLIVSFNKPEDFIVTGEQPVQTPNQNKEVLRQLNKTLFLRANPPGTLPQSFGDQLNAAIGEVAEAVNLVTGFVDTVMNEVDSIKASTQRALGLIKNARAKISTYQRTIGGQRPDAGVDKTKSVSSAYINAGHVANVSSNMFSLAALLASLASQIKAISATAPLFRHRVKSGETLQTISVKYYKDSSQWSTIYDHNKLSSATLTVGTVLEIPRK